MIDISTLKIRLQKEIENQLEVLDTYKDENTILKSAGRISALRWVLKYCDTKEADGQ